MIKQVILVPTYLGMSPGKVASQCCHVAVPFGDGVGVQKRIILKVESATHMTSLFKLKAYVNQKNDYCIMEHVFTDSAPTTEDTAGKVTAVSFIADEAIIDLITGHLELY
jgi:peptidyl-tRNA hydrolase